MDKRYLVLVNDESGKIDYLGEWETVEEAQREADTWGKAEADRSAWIVETVGRSRNV